MSFPDVGDQAPPISGVDVTTGVPFTLSNYLGKVVLIGFSGPSWCEPCKYEAPIIQELWDEVKHCNVQFVMVSVRDELQALKQAIQLFGWDMPVLMDLTLWHDIYKALFVPTIFILDKQHKICKREVGVLHGNPKEDKDEIRKWLYDCGMDCSSSDAYKRDLSKWAATVVITLGGVNVDGGGTAIWPSGKPMPIEPWGPFVLSRESRDIITSLAIKELGSMISDKATRIETQAVAIRQLENSVKGMELKFKIQSAPLENHFSKVNLKGNTGVLREAQ